MAGSAVARQAGMGEWLVEEGPSRRPSGRPRLRVIEGGLSRGASSRPCGRGAVRVPRAEGLLRAVAAGLLALAVVVASCVAASALDEARVREATSGVSLARHVVAGGETLWAIAQDHPVEGLSTSETVAYLRTENDLADAGVSAGQVLLVPCG